MGKPLIYLDHNATSPARDEVIAAVNEVMRRVGNASSVHEPGRRARAQVDRAREQVAALAGAKPDQVIFTSGGTEADNLALKGVGDRRLMVSAVEHGAVLAPALLRDPGCEILPVDGAGRVDLTALETALATTEKPSLVSVMYANNETGVIEPVAEVAALAHARGALVHSDTVQAAGKISLDIEVLGADMISLAAHKIGGPQGVGALILREDMELDAQQVGGGQERGRRSGTENVAGIVGFGIAAELAAANLDRYATLATLRDELERRVRRLAQDCIVFGDQVARLPNTSCLTMPGVKAETQIMAFDLEGIAVSAGAACSSGKVAPSHVLDAMGVPPEVALTAIRVSLGWDSTAADVDRFVDCWQRIRERAGATAAA